MSTRVRPRYTRLALTEPPVIEGDCPSGVCAETSFPLTPDGQVPEHRKSSNPNARRCPCSGWLARNPRPRKHFFVEGVRYL